jgi:antitoxin (DNA-binding transcriptional repressor) of toxin-antitoxin stability system
MNRLDLKETFVTVTATVFSNHRSGILNELGFGPGPVGVLRNGKPFVRLVPISQREEMVLDTQSTWSDCKKADNSGNHDVFVY